jgi:ubiquinone/menaquinone biosynthesis C-methylase UbiE
VGAGRRPPAPAQVAAGYDAAAAGYDARHGDRASRRRFAIVDGPQLAIARGAARVLELGCGTGRLLAEAEAAARVGIDVSPAMTRVARGRKLAVAVADAHALPFPDGAFDAVIAGKGVFRYLDYDRAMAACARVLAPGGRLGVHQYAARTFSPRQLLGRARAPEPLHVEDLEELYAPARAAGLRCERTYLWRSVRLWPYAVRIPEWAPGRFWSHCVLVFRKG